MAPRHHPLRTGFTLVELIVTVSIMALLLSISIPVMHHLLPDTRMSSTAREIASFIEDARDEAVISGRVVRLQYRLGDNENDEQVYRSIRDPEPGREDEAEEEEFLLSIQNWKPLGEGVRIESLHLGEGEEREIRRGEYEFRVYPSSEPAPGRPIQKVR